MSNFSVSIKYLTERILITGVASVVASLKAALRAITGLGAYFFERKYSEGSSNTSESLVGRFFEIKVNSRAGNSTEIVIPIGDVSHFTVTKIDLSQFFRLANEHTLNKPYPLGDTPIIHEGKKAYRPNHNGTHSARQAAHLKALFDLVEKKGSLLAKSAYDSLSSQEKMSLQIAAYLLRAGRVDESSHKTLSPDDYYTRSAIIYEKYAVQLQIDPKTIEWTKKLIVNSCKPETKRESDIDTDSKNKFGYEVLTMVHELDLVRCFNSTKMDQTIEEMRKRLDYFISDELSGTDKDNFMAQLVEHAKNLCAVTGCGRVFDNAPKNLAEFVKCSTDGAYCWEQTNGLPVPTWK